jgi:hypothetical protein
LNRATEAAGFGQLPIDLNGALASRSTSAKMVSGRKNADQGLYMRSAKKLNVA